jgi:ribonuclease T1
VRWRRPTRRQALFLALVCLLTAVGAAAIVSVGAPPAGVAAGPTASQTPRSDLPTVGVAELPAEARETLALIDRGGPFPFRQDATVFGNAEGILPGRDPGYYREYTVVTPGLDHRGARRLVVGAGGDVYYTADHYESFRQVLR